MVATRCSDRSSCQEEKLRPCPCACTTTLYQWIRGIIRTKNIDLLEKLSRKPKTYRNKSRTNKRILGKSISERPEEVDTRESFGHWEIDTVVGNKDRADAVLLTLVERKTRFEVIMKLEGKDAQSVDKELERLRERVGDEFPRLFQTITSDNGSEFSGLHDALRDTVDVYFSHPLSSWERGTSTS